MTPRNILLAQILTYSGTLPLVFCAGAAACGIQGINPGWLALTYGAIIISFLSGIHWAVYMFFSDRCPCNLLLTSNITALLALLTLLLEKGRIAYILQSLCFLYLLTLDLKLYNAAILPHWFYSLRRNATAIVILSLSILMFFA